MSYGTPCQVTLRTIDFLPGVRIDVHADTIEAWDALAAVMAHHNYPVRDADTHAYDCHDVAHALGIALDVNRDTNPVTETGKPITDIPKTMATDIAAIATLDSVPVFYRPLGRHPSHFELRCSAVELKAGIDWSTVARAKLVKATPATKWPILRDGSFGPTVKDAQRRLGKADILVLVDGSYGSETVAAVRQYQASRGLAVDGVVGAQTWTSLIHGLLPTTMSLVRRVLVEGRSTVGPDSRGDVVAEVQRLLTRRDYPAKVDGVLGPKTGTALLRFQHACGLEVDGVVGRQTWDRLLNG